MPLDDLRGMMSSQTFRFQFCDKIADFLAVAEPHLLCHEAQNNKMLGIALWCRQKNVLLNQDKIFILVFRGVEAVAAIMWAKPRPLIFVSFQTLAEDEIIEIQNLLMSHSLSLDLFGGEEGALQFLFCSQRTLVMRSHIMFLDELKCHWEDFSEISFRQAVSKDFDRLKDWSLEFYKEALLEWISEDAVRTNLSHRLNCYYILEKAGVPRAMATIVRETKSFAVLGGVYTPPEFRNRGFSQICVQKICEKILTEQKKSAALHVNVQNPAALHVYQKLGFKNAGNFVNYSRHHNILPKHIE